MCCCGHLRSMGHFCSLSAAALQTPLPLCLPVCRYLNTCFNQGSRTIRSEEAILISLAFLQPALSAAATAAGAAQ